MRKNTFPFFCYKLEKVTQKYLRPVYLIFDQFEELFILGTDDERSLFLKTLKTIVNHDEVIDCHIIIVMREEYFAWMDMFEAEIPEIVDRRLRIEPMRRKEIKEVITKSFQHFNIRLQEPNGDVEQIMKTLTGHEEKREVALTYLQVHLDQLWKRIMSILTPKDIRALKNIHPSNLLRKKSGPTVRRRKRSCRIFL